MIIAIDGPAGSGKTTTAKKVAKILGFMHVNTGAMYRGITLKFLNSDFDFDDHSNDDLQDLLDDTIFKFHGSGKSMLIMDGDDISDQINMPNVTSHVSLVSSIMAVRQKMVDFQRKISMGKNVVLEGRDIGTVVFPDAEHKFFLIADLETRAKRRKIQMEKEGINVLLDDIVRSLSSRDQKDMSRNHSPLIKAKDAIVLNTTDLSLDDQVNFIINIVNNN
jgi:cytidylate kinase